ncbi:type II secretion system protein GspC [Thermodesulfobacteriota bacterium]
MTKFYHTIFNLLALAAIIYIGIDAFYRVVRVQLGRVDTEKAAIQSIADNEGDVRSQLTDFKAIIGRNIFSTIEKAPEKAAPPKIEALEPTSLKIALLGTVSGNQQNAAAIIEETDKRKQGLYRVGDSVQNAVVKKIFRGKVILQVDEKDEILIMEEPRSAKEEKANKPRKTSVPTGVTRTITVRRSDLDKSLENINSLLSQASIRPHSTDGQADGLTITGIKAGSIFRKMGLRNGDIVHGVSGKEIKSPDDLISLYNDLTSESDISLQIKRRGRERTINYRFRD